MNLLALVLGAPLLAAVDARAAEPERPAAIDKITIAVDDLARMKAFYGKTFAIEFRDAEMGGATLASGRLGELEVLLCPKQLAGISATQNTIQLRFVVADAKATSAAALANGGTALTAPADANGRVTAAVRDPDGNSLELIQRR